MTLYFNGNEIGTVITNHSMTIEEAIYALGYDVNDPEDCERAYNDGFEPAYFDDCGEYKIDVEAVSIG